MAFSVGKYVWIAWFGVWGYNQHKWTRLKACIYVMQVSHGPHMISHARCSLAPLSILVSGKCRQLLFGTNVKDNYSHLTRKVNTHEVIFQDSLRRDFKFGYKQY